MLQKKHIGINVKLKASFIEENDKQVKTLMRVRSIEESFFQSRERL